MNYKKYIGILIVVLLLIAIMILLILLYENGKSQDEASVPENNGDDFFSDYAMSSDAYFDVNTCISKYLEAISTKNNILYTEDREEFNQRIYSLLSTNYIDFNNITVTNLYDYVEKIDNQVIFVPLEMSMIQNDTIKSFIVHGLVEDIIDLKVIDNIFAIVNIDIEKNAFSVEPIHGDYNDINEIKIEHLENVINLNEYNSFSRSQTRYEDIAKDYMNLYKRLALGYPEKLYEYLEEEYKNKKFGTVESFKKYIEERKDTIIGIQLQKYNISHEDEEIRYVCIDQYGKYYIFTEKDVFDFSVILDTYTIDIPEFIENYYGIEPTKKVALNIQKIFDAMNDKDYKYIYNNLAKGFKENYFPTLESFEQYVKENFYEDNYVSYLYYEKESEEYYSYTIKVLNKENESEYKLLKIIMSLKETTQFEFSFNVN